MSEEELVKAEDDIIDALGDMANLIWRLPAPHPYDGHEVSHAIHQLQNLVAARRTWRARRASWTTTKGAV